jgi:hypothetical protein
MWPVCWVSTPRSTAATGSASIVSESITADTYEMYRDFQENTINSDGSFGMWIVLCAALYTVHEVYNYMIPWYWK